MSHFAEFEAFIRVVPNNGRRFEYVRDLQRLGQLVYEEVNDNASNVTLAMPDGGQYRSIEAFSEYVAGTKVKPQFGETPAQLELTGYYSVSTANAQTCENTMVFHAGVAVSGPIGYKPSIIAGHPTSAVLSEVKALKSELESAITSITDTTGTDLKIFRLIYKGIIFGDRGVHFPL